MPAFTAVGAAVVSYLGGAAVLGTVGAAVLGAVVATGAAYITSRVINGNPNKGNNSSAGSQGGRIQVPPATNNKVPVLYGSAYVNGMITDARLKSIGGTTNDTMYYCIVLSEYTNNLTASPVYGLESVLWNDLRLTPVDATTNAHKVKDGRKVVDGAIVTSGSFVVGKTYIITKLGTTTQANWNTIAGTAGKVYDLGAIFTCANAGSATTGQAQEEDFIDTNFVVDSNSLVELRVYAGGSDDSNQIYPPQSTGNTANAYTFWANNDGSWTSANEMKGLVFAIVKLTYAGDKGFTGLPNVTFQLSNNVANPADVWYDYMTSKRYGAGIDPAYIDSTAKTAWYNFCEEDISYTNLAGETNQVDLRYQINGIIDTSRQVKTNIDTILQNGGAWMSYNVATGLWSPVIKKAISAGIPSESATHFTASRTGTTLTVSAFPSGRIEPGQQLYKSDGSAFGGTIVAQLFPLTAGETTGQIGRYTTSGSGNFTNFTLYALPTNNLEFSDDNIISGITLSSTRLEDLYNEVEAEFYNKYNKDQKAYARTDLPSIQRNPNEPDNQLRFSLDLVNSSIQADILSQLEMRQSRDDLVVEFTTNHYGIQTQAGDIIAVTSDLYGWAPKYFRVMRVKEIEGDDGGLTAQIQALEYNPDVYTIEPITEFSTAANIGIGNLISSVGLPAPAEPVISDPNPVASVPNFTFSIDVPATGGPFDEAEIYFAEGWDPNSVTGWIDNNSTPGTYSGVAGTIMTVTAVTYNSINPGDYFDLGGVTVVNQLTQTAISTKTFASGGAPGAFTVTLNNVTDVVIGQKPTGTGIPTDAMVVGVSGNTVTLDKAFTVQASGNYNFTTAGGTGTYTVNMSVAANGTDDIFDEPLDTDFSYLKKIVPDGNASAFTSGSTISTVITELRANSQTFRRYFLKARLGVKKNFGEFSANTPIDIDGNNVNWQPNPSSSGGPGLFGDINIALIDSTTISLTNNNQFIRLLQTTTSTNIPQNGLRISVESTGTPAAGFGTNLEFEIETAPGVSKQSGLIECVLTDVTTSSEDAKLEFTLLTAGSETPSVSPQLILENNGNLTTVGHFRTSLNDTATPRGVGGVTATNDFWFVGGYDVGAVPNAGAMVIASGNNGTEPIYVRQYTGPANPVTTDFPGTNTYINELTLLDANGNTIIPVSLALQGSTSGSVKFSAPATAGTQAYTLPTAQPGVSGYVLSSTTAGVLSWVADTNTTYTIGAQLASGGASVALFGSDSSTSIAKLANGTAITVAYTDPNTMTITNTGVTSNIAGTGISVNSATGAVTITNTGVTSAVAGTGVGVSSATGAVTFSIGQDVATTASPTFAAGSFSSLILRGSTSGTNTFVSPATAGTQTYTLPTAYPAANNYGLRSTTGGTLSWVVTGDVNGPSSSTTNAIAKFLDTTGKELINTGVTIDSANNIDGANIIDANQLYASQNISTIGYLGLLATNYNIYTKAIEDTATGNTLQDVDTWDSTLYRTAKYTLSMTKGTDYHSMEIMIIHDGTTAYMNTYSEMFTNASLATLTVDISGGNVRLRVTPATTGSLIILFERKLFDVT